MLYLILTFNITLYDPDYLNFTFHAVNWMKIIDFSLQFCLNGKITRLKGR